MVVYAIPCFALPFALNMVDHVISWYLFHLKHDQPWKIIFCGSLTISILDHNWPWLNVVIVSMFLHGWPCRNIGNLDHGRPWSNLCHLTFMVDHGQTMVRLLLDHVMHLSMLCRRGRGGRAWCGDLIVFVGPGVGHLTDLVLPGEGIFESFFARRGDIWLPTRTKKTETEHMFPASTLHACAIWFEKIRKSWRPMITSEGWVDFIVLSSNFVCFSVFLINWTS